MNKKVTVEWLQSIEAIKDVPADQLQWLIDQSEQVTIPAGGFLFKAGGPMENTNFIISGKVRICRIMNNKEAQEVARFEEKSIIGYLPFSRGLVSANDCEAIVDTEVMNFPLGRMNNLIKSHFELTQALVHIMTNRVRDFAAYIQQNEKMVALGKLSAGLAHELNNPAAAVVRGAVSLKKHLQLLPETFKDIISIRMSPEDVDIVNDRMFAVLNRNEHPTLSLMQRSDKEDELTEWLDDHNINNSIELAENFVEFGFGIADLEAFKEHIPTPFLPPIFNWINKNLVTERMVSDIEDASSRIAHLVNSIKTFTHMDQGLEKQLTDIHSGIQNTLTILQYKLRKNNIELIQHFDTNLPAITAHVGQLNQVWTNLLDNALDAMEVNQKGILEIRTEIDGDCIQITITDNGPGIPADVKSKIFDPFFTTKEVGKGTGLGLDIVNQIVRRHRGTIRVNSVPGHTEFIVHLPING
ncbi:Cyclic nucleotide-binding domain-containing protein [Chitinophaga sp. CF118]|uniref:ATP-binding protein n=1 Tax=Chitinophaga sp. CF118 TaxID=1884367 RepID=UPI0008EEF377|nr:ATP-binding protein [Chitinophaga sp. CF118]SFE34435.1 Cyclic nucleotide-binding domain-containing protein [Chitinophaga sp. CF118]